jgi:hypothetical protein
LRVRNRVPSEALNECSAQHMGSSLSSGDAEQGDRLWASLG